MFEISVESIVVALSYFGIFLLMVTNGSISFPSSQVLYIITGYFIFTGALFLPLVVLVGALGNTVGCVILYEVARSKGLKYITKFKFFPEQVIKKVQVAFQKRGVWFVFIAKLIPALKVFVPIPAGISKMSRPLYLFAIFTSSAIWTAPFIAIGYYFGKSSDVFSNYAIILMFVALIMFGLFYRYINKLQVVQDVYGGQIKTLN